MTPHSPPGEPIEINHARPLTVLIAEDDPNDILFLRRAFAKSGLRALLHEVVDGEEAKAYLEGAPPFDDRAANPLPDVLLLDLGLPRFSGLELLEWLRNQPGLSQIPTVVLTGSAAPKEIERAYSLGAQSCLVKQPDLSLWVPLVRTLERYAPPSVS